MAYVMQCEGLDHHAAEARIHHKDHERARYLEREYHHKLGEAQLYDLVLNTSLLDLENAVDILCFILQRKATGMAKTTGELGPATGLSRYPAAPVHFPSL